MAPGTSFQPVLTEHVEDPTKVERVVILSGKLYYELVKERQERGLEGKIVFIRLEVRRRLRSSSLPLFGSRSALIFPSRLSLTALTCAGDLALPLCRPLGCSRPLPQDGALARLGAGRAVQRRRVHVRRTASAAGASSRRQAAVRWARGDGDGRTGRQELLRRGEEEDRGRGVRGSVDEQQLSRVRKAMQDSVTGHSRRAVRAESCDERTSPSARRPSQTDQDCLARAVLERDGWNAYSYKL